MQRLPVNFSRLVELPLLHVQLGQVGAGNQGQLRVAAGLAEIPALSKGPASAAQIAAEITGSGQAEGNGAAQE
jgi:hypothetical protein